MICHLYSSFAQVLEDGYEMWAVTNLVYSAL